MKFIAWYCHKCKMYFGETELNKHKCPECEGSVIPQPMESKGEQEMNKWEYNVIDQRNYTTELSEDNLDTMLNSFGADGWELVGWFGTWLIFKRKLSSA